MTNSLERLQELTKLADRLCKAMMLDKGELPFVAIGENDEGHVVLYMGDYDTDDQDQLILKKISSAFIAYKVCRYFVLSETWMVKSERSLQELIDSGEPIVAPVDDPNHIEATTILVTDVANVRVRSYPILRNRDGSFFALDEAHLMDNHGQESLGQRDVGMMGNLIPNPEQYQQLAEDEVVMARQLIGFLKGIHVITQDDLLQMVDKIEKSAIGEGKKVTHG